MNDKMKELGNMKYGECGLDSTHLKYYESILRVAEVFILCDFLSCQLNLI